MSARLLDRRTSSTKGGLIRIGNTYRRLSDHVAPYDRSGTIRKVHDVTIYAEVDSTALADIIEKVTFDLGSTFQPRLFTCHSPVPVKTLGGGGAKAMRFSTRQTMYGSTNATIKVRCRGGTTHTYEHSIVLEEDSTPTAREFSEPRPLRPLRPVGMIEGARFGIELELTSSMDLSSSDLASQLSSRCRNTSEVRVITSYSEGREQINGWKLVPDSSISCNISQPDCNKFELVSPVLQGGDGLGEVSKITSALGTFRGQIKVNKSMGYHCHIDVSKFSLEQLIKVCQNFIKYETVMDSFVPPSRRTGSEESNRYFQSNRVSVSSEIRASDSSSSVDQLASNREMHQVLSRCQSIQELAHAMNSNGSRYYKLNLQNLVTGRQPTIEFRQHSATSSYDKVSLWIRFCSRFVHNSAKLASPSPFSQSTGLSKQTDALFYYLIKDRALRAYYLARMDELGVADDEGEDVACCTGCATGGTCSVKRSRHA